MSVPFLLPVGTKQWDGLNGSTLQPSTANIWLGVTWLWPSPSVKDGPTETRTMVSILDPEQKEGLGVCLLKTPCISESVVCVTFDYLLVFVNLAAVILYSCCNSLTRFPLLVTFRENGILQKRLARAPGKRGMTSCVSLPYYSVVEDMHQRHALPLQSRCDVLAPAGRH